MQPYFKEVDNIEIMRLDIEEVQYRAKKFAPEFST